MRWSDISDGSLNISHGKTENARRVIPMTPRVSAMLEMRRTIAANEWLFPATTRSRHIEKSSLRKQHQKACMTAGIQPFLLYTLRHTCLTRWAAHMARYTLAYLAGHSDFSTTSDMSIRKRIQFALRWNGLEMLRLGILLGIPPKT